MDRAVKKLLALALAATAGACGHRVDPPSSPLLERAATDWKTVVTDDDRKRLRGWRDDFVAALAEARATGHGGEIAAFGPLLDPDAAPLGTPLANGNYKCRVIKLGSKSGGMLPFIAYPAFDCRVQQEKALQGLAKLSGSQRPIGLLFPDSASRHVFLGTLVLGDEERAMQYGRDPDRDLAAWVEQIGPDRWRMIFPSPRYESRTDVIELVPAP